MGCRSSYGRARFFFPPAGPTPGLLLQIQLIAPGISLELGCDILMQNATTLIYQWFIALAVNGRLAGGAICGLILGYCVRSADELIFI